MAPALSLSDADVATSASTQGLPADLHYRSGGSGSATRMIVVSGQSIATTHWEGPACPRTMTLDRLPLFCGTVLAERIERVEAQLIAEAVRSPAIAAQTRRAS